MTVGGGEATPLSRVGTGARGWGMRLSEMVCQHAVLLLHVQFLAFLRIPLLLRCSEVLDSLNSDRDIMPLIEDLSTKFALVRWVESWCSAT
jgi:hypothetical protein